MRQTKPSVLGPMLGVPIAEQRSMFEAWVRAGQRPDSHPSVLPVSFSPPNSEVVEVVGELSLLSSFQDSTTYFHCNVCGVERKFKNDGFCSTYGDGYWYFEGPDCGGDLHRQALNRGILQFDAARSQNDSEKRIGKFYASFEQWREILLAAREAAKEQMAFQKKLKELQPLWDELISAGKNFGQLEIETLTFADDEWNYGYCVNFAPFGQTSGAQFLKSPFIPTGLAKKAREKFQEISSVRFEKEAFELAFGRARESKRLKQFEERVRDVEDAIRKLTASVTESGKFLSHDNLRLLEDWHRERRKRQKAILEKLPYEHLRSTPRMKLSNTSQGGQLLYGSFEPVELNLEKSRQFVGKLPYF